jgi:phosphotriesterase-related protein
VEELRDWMIGELTGGVDGAGVTAGWIKTAASDNGLTDQERKGLRAAAGAGAATGAAIGCHAVRGVVARDALTVVERSGYRAERFIWIHADQERDRALHEELARHGAWVEFDSIGHGPGDDEHVEMVQHLLDTGLGEHVLLSMDSGWFDPGLPDCREGCIKGYTYLSHTFLPKLRDAGVDGATIDRLTRVNPFQAFARPR